MAMYQMIEGKQIFLQSLKNVKKNDAANYRPVSLTCICCKTLVSNINTHLALDSILIDCQHGFSKCRGLAKLSWSSLCKASSTTWMGLGTM